jgi:uncharacterized protein
MNNIHQKIADVDWEMVTGQMNEKEYALVSTFLPDQYSDEITSNYNNPELYRKTIIMERHRFGLGEYKYFKYPLPGLIQTIRTAIIQNLDLLQMHG